MKIFYFYFKYDTLMQLNTMHDYYEIWLFLPNWLILNEKTFKHFISNNLNVWKTTYYGLKWILIKLFVFRKKCVENDPVWKVWNFHHFFYMNDSQILKWLKTFSGFCHFFGGTCTFVAINIYDVVSWFIGIELYFFFNNI